MRDVAPLTMTAWFYLRYCERLFFGFLDCDCALKACLLAGDHSKQALVAEPSLVDSARSCRSAPDRPSRGHEVARFERHRPLGRDRVVRGNAPLHRKSSTPTAPDSCAWGNTGTCRCQHRHTAPGAYATFAELASALQAALNATATGIAKIDGFTVIHSAVTRKFTIGVQLTDDGSTSEVQIRCFLIKTGAMPAGVSTSPFATAPSAWTRTHLPWLLYRWSRKCWMPRGRKWRVRDEVLQLQHSRDHWTANDRGAILRIDDAQPLLLSLVQCRRRQQETTRRSAVPLVREQRASPTV